MGNPDSATAPLPNETVVIGLQVGLQLLKELPLALGADDPVLGFTILEQNQRGDAHDLEPASDLEVLVDVDLANTELALVVAGDLLEDRSDHLARTAPFGPEVHEHRLTGALDLLV